MQPLPPEFNVDCVCARGVLLAAKKDSIRAGLGAAVHPSTLSRWGEGVRQRTQPARRMELFFFANTGSDHATYELIDIIRRRCFGGEAGEKRAHAEQCGVHVHICIPSQARANHLCPRAKLCEVVSVYHSSRREASTVRQTPGRKMGRKTILARCLLPGGRRWAIVVLHQRRPPGSKHRAGVFFLPGVYYAVEGAGRVDQRCTPCSTLPCRIIFLLGNVRASYRVIHAAQPFETALRKQQPARQQQRTRQTNPAGPTEPTCPADPTHPRPCRPACASRSARPSRPARLSRFMRRTRPNRPSGVTAGGEALGEVRFLDKHIRPGRH